MRIKQLGLWICLLHGSAMAAPSASQLLNDFREASGGAAWDQVQALRARGLLAVGGLEGPFEAVEHLPSGRNRSAYELGPLTGAEGFDGERRWSQDPGGEIRLPDGAADRASTLSQAWLSRRAYWYPQRQDATYGQVSERQADGRDWYVVDAQPAGGVPLTLWFGADSQLLERVVQTEGGQQVLTDYRDWRTVGAIKLPFASSVDRGDPRNRVQIRFEQIEINPELTKSAFAVPEAAGKARIADASGRSQIRVDLRNNHLYADARIDGKPVRMLIDTGGVNILTPVAAQRLGLASQGQLSAQGVGQQRAGFGMAKASRLELGAAQLDAPVIYVLDLGPLAQIEGEDLDGIIGYELFHHFGVRIDYAGGQIELTDPSRFQAPAGATALPFELAERIPVIAGKLDGLPVKLTVDTGSRASLTVHGPFAKRHELGRKYAAAHEAVIGFGVGGPSRGFPVRMGELELGGLKLQQIAGDLFSGDKGAFADPDHSANIGSGLLKRFIVSFDYRSRTIYLEPNAEFDQADAFDRSGLWLRTEGDHLRIMDIAAGSAAAESALRVDQLIIAIDGQPANSRHLSEWRALLRETGRAQVALSLSDGRTVTLKLKDRIADRWVAGTR